MRVNFQGTTESGHRLGQELDALGAAGPDALLYKRIGQVVLGLGPILGKLLAGRIDRQFCQYEEHNSE